MKKRHPLIHTLLTLKGNSRASVWTEPLWGIPFFLYGPYASMYMYALGVNDKQIGIIVSLGLMLQVVFALLSGAITDKLGRRKTTFIFDIICWSIPTLIWAAAQNIVYFVIAAIINSTWRITNNSWTCLLVEDSDEDSLVGIYSWVHISGLISAFFAPLAGLFIALNGLVPTVRVLYIVAFIMMTTKFVILYKYSTETRQGIIRMEQVKDQSIFTLLSQYGGVFKHILGNPKTLITLGIMLVMSIYNTINGTFWSLLLTERLGIPDGFVSWFPFLRSFIMLILFFVVVPRINLSRFRKPMITGFIIAIIAQCMLLSAPEKGYAFIIISTICEAFALALISPLMDSLIVVTVDPHERARIMAILNVIMIAVTSPFGMIAGFLSDINRILPFVLNIALFALGAMLVLISVYTTKSKVQLSA